MLRVREHVDHFVRDHDVEERPRLRELGARDVVPARCENALERPVYAVGDVELDGCSVLASPGFTPLLKVAKAAAAFAFTPATKGP